MFRMFHFLYVFSQPSMLCLCANNIIYLGECLNENCHHITATLETIYTFWRFLTAMSIFFKMINSQ